MKDEIEKEIINLDVEKINFDDNELLKRLFLLLLNRIELQAQQIQRQREEIQQLKDEIAHLVWSPETISRPSGIHAD